MKLLVTAGPTREFFDSVRYISNASTGRMGYAIAQAGARRAHEVVLVSGPVEIAAPHGVRVIQVTSAAEMLRACEAEFEHCDAAIMAAAVCDYRPIARSDRKLKKDNKPLAIELEPTEDICAHLGRFKDRRVVIGFALEDGNETANAEAKLKKKSCDAIVLNGLGNIGAVAGSVRILLAGAGWQPPWSGDKPAIAERIVECAEQLTLSRA
ncbi:MAG: phosphopantothenoylcysteine decarboxylase [Phycisphaerales bacterium]|nr:phosphopantothenoylcysteine decarboxylase [Phycisphaerales bacterium]